MRDDYQVLVGTNSHSVTPLGWVQEEENLKTVLDADGVRTEVLAREVGLARYERIEGFDWSPGDAYWAQTAPVWAVVRDVWNDLFENNARIELVKEVDGMPLFMAMFLLADQYSVDFDADATRLAVEKSLQPYLTLVELENHAMSRYAKLQRRKGTRRQRK